MVRATRAPLVRIARMPDEQPTDTTPDLRAPHGALPEGGTVRAITRWGTPVMHRPQAAVT